MLLGAGPCGAGRAHAAAGAAACAGPGRAVAGGGHWGVRSVCAGGVRSRPRRGLHCRVSAGGGGRRWASGAEAVVRVGAGLLHASNKYSVFSNCSTTHDIWENWAAGASHAGDSFSLGL